MFEITNHAIGEEKNEHGYRGERHEPDVDAAMQALARVAKLTLHQVRLVVAAHFRSEARDVVAPSGKDFADDAVSTLCHQSRRTLRAPQRARRAETTVGPRAAVHAVPRAAIGCATSCAARPRHARLSSGRSPDDCWSPKGAPERGTRHFHHSRRSGIPRACRWRDG